jgi:tRNA A-37 threonylcarbamoyl transferase component Bud32
MAAEARVMDFVRRQGYPVPAVDRLSDDGTELVMERVDGPSMAAALARRPWTLRAQGALLGDLHRRLHEIAAPGWLRPSPLGAGETVVHLDLHPLNVLMTRSGPVVIDWANAAAGDGPTDVALTWVLVKAGEIPTGRVRATVMGWFREAFVAAFLGGFDLAPVRPCLRSVVEWKVRDPNMSPVECRTMRAMADAERPST